MKLLKHLTVLFICACCFSLSSYSINYVSQGSGPWHISGTWIPAGVPGFTDNVTIMPGHIITINAVGDKCNNLTVNGRLSWTAVNTLTVQGEYVISATGSETGSGYIQFNPPGTLITVAAGGVTSPSVNYSFYTSRTITAGSVINKVSSSTRINTGKVLTNLGNYKMGAMDDRSGSTFINGAGGIITIKNTGFMVGNVFTANAPGNTVILTYGGSIIPAVTSGTFYNLSLFGSGAKTLSTNTTVLNSLTIGASNTLNSNNFNVTVGGNWSNSGTFVQGVKTVTLNGSGTQTIGGTSTTTFFNLVKNGTGTAILAHDEIVTGLLTISGGIFDTDAFALTGAAGLTQSTGELILGKTSATVPQLTGAYTITGGKITFDGAGAQTIRSGINYANVDVTGSGTKSLAGAITVTGSLFISSTLDVTASNFAINLRGNWTNNGTFVQRLGTVTLNGTGAQVLSGSASTAFENLTLNNTNGATITSGTYSLNGALTLSNGTFNTGGNSFTMTSSASKTARIAPLTGTGSIAGNFVVQRFISTRDTSWSDLSSPVQGTTFADWDNELPAVSYTYIPPNQYPTQYTYSEPADDFVPITSAATALTPGKGYEVFLAGSFSYSDMPNSVIDVVGVPNQGNQDLSGLISFNGAGSNLVGNPFASSISWSTVFAASSRISNTYDVYDFTAGNYSTFGLGTEIGSGQGFWVYSTGASPHLVINENAKTTSLNSTLRSAVAEPYFTLKLSSNDEGNTYYHLLKVAADVVSSDGWDENDHPYHKSPNKYAPSIVSAVGGKKLTINTFNAANSSYSMPLETKAGIAGYYKIEAAGFENLDYNCIKLEDKLLNKMIVLTDSPYSFEMNPGDDANRFIVHFSKDQDCGSVVNAATGSQKDLALDFANNVNILPSSEGNLITFNLDEATDAIISVTNLLGQTITESISVVAQSQSVNIAIPQDFSGMYLVKVESAKGTTIKKFVRK